MTTFPMPREAAPVMKDWFDETRFRTIAGQLAALDSRFHRKRFLARSLDGLDQLSLLQRLRRMSESTREALPLDYRDSLEVLRSLAPQIDHKFVTLFLPDFVGLYGQGDFAVSMEALKFFTPFGSSEFAIREFLKRDLHATLAVMHEWSHDPDEHVRRLASEGCRPRLPWSFHLPELIADPGPALPLLEKLRADPSLYVRKSVANHLNDISRDNPDITLQTLTRWGRDNPRTAWIAKRALRTLIKEGRIEALTLLGAGEPAKVRIESFTVSPEAIALGEEIRLSLHLISTAKTPQRILIDYIVHYVKQSGGTSEKVFKWKEIELGPREAVVLQKRQTIRDFSTRKHCPGRHRVELQVNGKRLAETAFGLTTCRT